MTLSSRTRLGPYEVICALGAGGMGEVYRARDTTLNRDVAIKVLPALFADNPDRLARFRREAQLLAALNHPNIAHIHGFEDADGIHALVMELIDGPTLADRIAEGPIPVAEALSIARQIAEALETAHNQGIIHRDLKPANVKVRDDGTVKVLDFGLAKLAAPETSDNSPGSPARAPTVTSPAMTLAGVILGTAAYMSPEQTKGRPADKRSDVWAFGAVLYEMLTARRAFEGEDVSETLANVLKSEPDWTALPADLPGHVTNLVRRCLAKDRQQRISDIAVALFVMTDDAGHAPADRGAIGQIATTPPLWRRLAVLSAASIALAAAVGAAVWWTMRPGAPRVMRFAIPQTTAGALSVDAQSRDLTITPDGTHIVYKGASTATSDSYLYVRALDQLEPTVLTTTGMGRAPFASPDGQWIGFVDPSPITLKKVAITGGPAIRLCALDGPSRGATWGEDDNIIFATGVALTGLQRVSSAGGQPTVLTRPNRERGEGDHLWPQMLPGSQAVLFTITPLSGGTDASQVAVLDLRNPHGTPKILLQGGSQAQYLSSGHLVYVAGGTLRAVAFDLKRLELSGAAVPVVPQVVILPSGTAEFDVARNGTLVYVTGGAHLASPRSLVWVDRQGHEEAIKGVPLRSYVHPRLSPDDTRVALDVRDQENDIWIWEFGRGTFARLTIDPGNDQMPVWMPDGSVVFSSQTGGTAGSLFRQPADGTRTPERLTEAVNTRASTVSPDGTRILFSEPAATTGLDVKMLVLAKDKRVEPLIQTPFAERNAEISPDGRWVAYESNDSGEFQIYVRPFPDVTKGKWPVSVGGGTQPLWARNGQELFYLGSGNALMSVRVKQDASWSAATPTKLIEAPYYRGGGTITSRSYDVSADGKRFLMIKDAAGSGPSAAPLSIVVVQNWFEELRRLAPATR
jgi:serine/threonine-protein kinase